MTDPKRRLDQDAQHLGHLAHKLLPGEAQQVRGWNDGDVRRRELPEMQAREEVQRNGNGDKRPEQIDQHGRGAGAAPEHGQEVARVEAASAALAFVRNVV